MMNFATKILTSPIAGGSVGVFALGQAGFVIKTGEGKLIALDPYLSNCCERYFGFKRLMPYVLDPLDIEFDLLIASHAHYDHFDPDSVPSLMGNKKTHFIGALDTRAECDRLGITERVSFLARGEEIEKCGVKIKGLACDHGDLAPDALGLMITVGEKRICFMGDTAYREDLLENEELNGVDLLILPINGAFGNLNEEQAAKVVAKLKPKLALPCHYWNFAEHGGSPALFMENMKSIAPDSHYVLLRPTEEVVI